MEPKKSKITEVKNARKDSTGNTNKTDQKSNETKNDKEKNNKVAKNKHSFVVAGNVSI